ncbi:MAG TPA: hypothetical protein VKE93_10930 [Candidatus Angelobacter sp.]|nr:hypothetical protein [Candidatus Angelobacter sp.]
MTRISQMWVLTLVLANALLILPRVSAQQTEEDKPQPSKQVPTAPVPSPILRAKKVFISNLGSDLLSLELFRRLGEPDRPYNQFYAAVKDWGRYDLVSSPADADLIIEIQVTFPVISCGRLETCQLRQAQLTILDPKTHFTLWSLVESVEGGRNLKSFEKGVNQGMDSLMADLKRLVAQPAFVADGAAR